MKKLYKDIWIFAAINGPEATAGNPFGIRCFLYKHKKDFGKKRRLLPLKLLKFISGSSGLSVELKFKSTKDDNGLIGWNEAYGNLSVENGVGTFTLMPESKQKKA